MECFETFSRNLSKKGELPLLGEVMKMNKYFKGTFFLIGLNLWSSLVKIHDILIGLRMSLLSVHI